MSITPVTEKAFSVLSEKGFDEIRETAWITYIF